MEGLKRLMRGCSLRKSIVLYISVFAALALALSMATSFLCSRAAENIYSSYPETGKRYYLTTENGERLGEGSIIRTQPAPLSQRDERLLSVLEIAPVIAAPLYSALCILAAALLFYANKLKRPLEELKMGSEKIAGHDLDFSISYTSGDELGRLCASFETMRSALARNFSDMWRQMEQRKQVNAAFAHDLRTPLTVLKGYNEMLAVSHDAQTRETALTMGKHLTRLEQYVQSMSSLQRLEDMQPDYRDIPLQELLSSLAQSARIVCAQNGKKCCVQNETACACLAVDRSFVTQAFNNILSNALRYSSSAITILFSEKEDGLCVCVSDDGKGFPENCLQKAAAPYYTQEGGHTEHFGLGLYICKLLCAHHGGYLKLENLEGGAKVSAFFKTPHS